MKFEPTSIPHCFLIISEMKKDARGYFMKTFHWPTFERQGLDVQLKESFYTLSKKNVLRGFHFQVPPCDHDKLVYCVKGEVFDVVVDIRKKSPAYGKALGSVLSEDNGRELFIPKGLAHAFLTLSPEAVMVYNTTTPYSPKHDRGIHWKSVPVRWPIQKPIVSRRDRSFPVLENFNSPFKYSQS